VLVGGGLALVCVLLILSDRVKRPRVAAVSATVALLICSVLVTYLWHGTTEAHFHFFVVVAAVALYQDWLVFAASLAMVVGHHALVGSLAPQYVYGDLASTAHHLHGTDPLVLAGLHGAFVLAAAGFQVAAWAFADAADHRARKAVTSARADFESAFEHAPMGMALIGRDGRFLQSNAALDDFFGKALDEGSHVRDLDLTGTVFTMDELVEAVAASESVRLEGRGYTRPNGQEVVCDIVVSGVLRDGEIDHVVAQVLDVTAQRAFAEELELSTRTDPLTGLANRRGIDQALQDDQDPSVLYMDLDRFKAVNDVLGHGGGDDLLVQVARRLRAALGAGAFLGRPGGDEFVAVLASSVDASAAAAAVQSAIAEPFEVAGACVSVGVSVGVVSASGSVRSSDELLAGADAAMYAAKADGKGRSVVFDEELEGRTARRVETESTLRWALEDPASRMPVVFQPICRTSDGAVLGAEALVRMTTQDGGAMSPADFIPVAEDAGLVSDVGDHVLRIALAQLRQWGSEVKYVSVNVSAYQVEDERWVESVRRALEDTGADATRLVLELTESAVIGSDDLVQSRLSEVRALGVRVALDDFGTGHSSLTHLKDLPADIIKIDRSFVSGLSSDLAKGAIITSLVWLADTLGMEVVAEGVEDEADLVALRSSACHYVQGYLTGRPGSAETLSARLGACSAVPA
jgi:diguanylate cyclase (GGDEF)-like protein/PAS domain S-box-containing protein